MATITQHIKRIYQSFDFRGNKIIGALTPTPKSTDHKETIVNKEYVDKNLKFRSKINSESPQNEKPLNDVVDSLLYGSGDTVTFREPEVKYVHIISDNNSHIGNRKVVFEGNSLHCKIKVELKLNDFKPSRNSKITINNGEETVVRQLPNQEAFEFDITLADSTAWDNLSIVYEHRFLESVEKMNNKNQPITNTQEVVVTTDLTERFKSMFVLVPTIYVRNIDDPSTPQSNDIVDYVAAMRIDYQRNKEAIIDCLIPKTFYDHYDLGFQLKTVLDKIVTNEEVLVLDNLLFNVAENVIQDKTYKYLRLHFAQRSHDVRVTFKPITR